MTSIRRAATCLALLAAFSLATASGASAATHVWIGPSGGLWSSSANWSGGSKPTSGESGGTIVQFGAGTTSTMDIAGLTVDQIHFTGGGNTINGSQTLTINGSTLAQNIVSEGAENTLGSTMPITIVGALTEITSSTGTLTLKGPIAGSTGLVFVGTGGSLDLYDENTYTGPTDIASGAMHIAAPVGLVIEGSSIMIGNGFETGAQLVMDQSSDISTGTAIVVNPEGRFEGESFVDNAKSLTVDGGVVDVGGLTMPGELVLDNGSVSTVGGLWAGSLSMTGGTISGASNSFLQLSGNVAATSSLSGPATISTAVHLNASPTVNVTAGTPPELQLTGPISETGGSRSITKAGTGTMLTSGANTYTGATTVSAGTLIANGTQSGGVTVEPSATLTGSGTFGAAVVNGALTPTAPGLTTGSLTLGSTARLDQTLTSFAAGAVPSLIAGGAVTISPSAALNLVVAPGTAMPHGSQVALIENHSALPITGQFSGFPSGSVLSTAVGVPLALSYTGGDGNDLTLTAGNLPPQVGSIVVPAGAVAGQPVALSVPASDPNQDPLTTTWSFGDGSSGSGSATTHTYASPGSYTVVATVFDGLAQVQSTAVLTVGAPSAAPHPVTPAPSGSSTMTASAFGAQFSLSFPQACVRSTSQATVALNVRKLAKAKGKVLTKVLKVTFAVGGKTVKTVRSSPFRASIAVPRGSASGKKLIVHVTVYALVRGGGHRTKSFNLPVTVC